MTNDEIRIAVAEACNRRLFVIHKPIHDPFGYYCANASGYTNDPDKAWQVTEEVARRYASGRPYEPDRVVIEPAPIPDYCSDLNAMHAAEHTLNATQQLRYSELLSEPFVGQRHWTHVQFDIIHTTTRQRAEAFLRTLGKWREG